MAPRPTWRLACALFAAVAAATTIAPANSSTTALDSAGTINLQDSRRQNITTLVPLTPEASEKDLDGALFSTTDANANNISQSEIAFISCDTSSYPGNIKADRILSDIHTSGKASAAILYSTTAAYCNYTSDDAALSQFPIYSTTTMDAARTQKDQLAKLTAGEKFFVHVARSAAQNDSADPNSQTQGQTNPLGPSPSTAVAMIILYSITGVITALFLVIIITGALRAHRHPDRYGPRDVLGRPRQSRARGLGMAILDTIPIVKFGEREQPKPADVELGSTSEARGVDPAAAPTDVATTTPAAADAPVSTPPAVATDHAEGQDSGIAPAAGAVVAGAHAAEDEGLGCSICTDDFEKGQDIRVLPCNHKFHPECVDPWLLNVSGTCPLCRVDLRPTTSNTSSLALSPDDALAPPLQASPADPSTRRHSTLGALLSFRSRPNASADERISALRRLREQRRDAVAAAVVAAAAAGEDGSADAEDRRRSRRLSFFGRRRAEGVGSAPTGASASATTPTPVGTDASPAGDPGALEHATAADPATAR